MKKEYYAYLTGYAAGLTGNNDITNPIAFEQVAQDTPEAVAFVIGLRNGFWEHEDKKHEFLTQKDLLCYVRERLNT